MFSESAELYDLVYSSFKQYGTETDAVAAIIRSVNPDARTVLDVACGTGEHARLLGERHGFEVDGVDLDPVFVRIAAGNDGSMQARESYWRGGLRGMAERVRLLGGELRVRSRRDEGTTIEVRIPDVL